MPTYLPYLLIAVGGALGALARYGLSGWVQGNRLGFPWGTLLVNLLGCFVMGLLAYWIERGFASPQVRFALGLGFLGGFTTFSSFSMEALRLWMAQSYLLALGYVGASMLGCLTLTALGYLLARAIWR